MGRSKNSVTGKSRHRKKYERKEKRKKLKLKLASGVSDISRSLTMLFRIPLKDFRKARKAKNGKWTSFLLLPLSVFPFALALIGKIVFSPVEIVAAIAQWRLKNMLYKVPAFLALLVVVVSFFTGWWSVFGNEHYAKKLKESLSANIADGDFAEAVDDFDKLIDANVESDSEAYMELVEALIKAGETDKVTGILAKLAPGPDGNPGIPEAHQKVVIRLINEMKSGESRDLALLKWHLDKSGEPKSIESLDAWARYWLAIENDREAIKYIRRAANFDPKYFIDLANLYERTGDDTFRAGALADARVAFERKLAKEPKSDRTRLVLSKVLFDLNEFDECEKVLEAGHELTNSPGINEACANFYVDQFVRSAKNRSFESNTELIQEAFQLAPNSRFVQRAFSQLYGTTADETQKASIVESLKMAAKVESMSTKANFLLSVLMHHDGNLKGSLDYSEKAYNADPKSPPYNNNLAWQFAHAEPPQLDRALKLAKFAVESSPNNASFRDTLGTILFKLSMHKEAILELKKSLTLNEYPVSKNGRISVHEKLADCYEELGFPEMAKLHKDNVRRAQSESQ